MQSEIKDININDENQVESILERYKPLVISIARRYYLVGADLDDLVQEGMIGLYKAINSYNSNKNSSFTTFASLCITRHIQSAITKNNRLKNSVFNIIMNEDDFFITEIWDELQNPEEKIIQRESFSYLKEQIKQKLSSLEKKILKEYLNGKSYDDISKILSIPKKSVDNGLNRIRNKLSYLLNIKE